jgi:sugar phosphate isomerase/epimerase
VKIGLKLGTDQSNYWCAVQSIQKENNFDYIELFVKGLPNSKLVKGWLSFNVPIVLHAPHSYGGMNPSLAEHFEANKKKISEVAEWSLALEPKFIVYHAGLNGTLEETMKQFIAFKELYAPAYHNAVIENKPAVGVGGEICLGKTKAELSAIMQTCNMGFCLDFGHAYCAAASLKLDPDEYINDLLQLKPKMYHLAGNNTGSEIDAHMHFSKGNTPLSKWIRSLPQDAFATLETEKDSKDNLNDFVNDSKWVKGG